LLEQMDGRSHT